MEENPNLIIGEAQLVLAEKRTNLAALRTGLALLGLPMGVISFLVAFAKDRIFTEFSALIWPLLVVCLCLAALGSFLIIRATVRVHRNDRALKTLQSGHQEIRAFMD